MYIARLVKLVFETLEENSIATIKVKIKIKVKVKVKCTTEETRKAYGVAEVPTAPLFIIFGIRWR